MSLASLWLPIVPSAVFVFIASALINMFLKFWHEPDYRRFSNEDETRAAIRNGNPTASPSSGFGRRNERVKPEARPQASRAFIARALKQLSRGAPAMHGSGPA